jgi:hypothetical protein
VLSEYPINFGGEPSAMIQINPVDVEGGVPGSDPIDGGLALVFYHYLGS